ncbi:hypothetical protein [Hymenobacter rubripertinctus]|uniref:hypothetical protein n=1 Tax=Hymenobacter rubripertinctus TaxID=2029981 RepID=UPI0011C40DFD|nr:hypothetical protein [Hymenobacter rubripertinctus]
MMMTSVQVSHWQVAYSPSYDWAYYSQTTSVEQKSVSRKSASANGFGFEMGSISFDRRTFLAAFMNTPDKSILDRTGDAVGSHGLFTGYFAHEIERAAALGKSSGRLNTALVPFIRTYTAALGQIQIKPSTAFGFEKFTTIAAPLFKLYTFLNIFNDRKITAGNIYEAGILRA